VKKKKRKEKPPVMQVTDSWSFWTIPCHILPFLSQKLTCQMSINWPKVNIWSSEKFHNLGTGLYNYLRTMAFSKASYLMLPSSDKSVRLPSAFTTRDLFHTETQVTNNDVTIVKNEHVAKALCDLFVIPFPSCQGSQWASTLPPPGS
jgi:hypothetical protein